MKKYKTIFLSGFLGQKSDWDFIPESDDFLSLTPEDLFKNEKINNLDSAAKMLNKIAEAASAESLVAYSLGGRIALNALCLKENPWKKAVIISAHPGLKTLEEKEIRLKNDQNWAQRFLEMPWEELMEQWNNQTVFSGNSLSLHRLEKSVNRKMLASIMMNFSLALQSDLRQNLTQVLTSILFVAGEKDSKFSELAKEMKELTPHSRFLRMQGVGHRVPWESKDFWNEINFFLEER